MKFIAKNYILLFVVFLTFITNAQTEITYADYASNVAKISKDSLLLVKGNTYSFTVDTAEDNGLVSTAVPVDGIRKQIKSKNGSNQSYKIIDQKGNVKSTGLIEENDQLVVTTDKSKKCKIYKVGLKPGAKSGLLTLENRQLTANTSRDLTLCFTAGQRTPNATIKFELPLGVNATMDNTTVNIIGRGEVKLKDLSSQSIGRAGSAVSYTKVGQVNIENSKEGRIIVVFSNIDLRPYNGIDLKMTIHNVKLTKIGNYFFNATYTTTEPEVLVSPGVGTETTSLVVVKSISDFERVLDPDLKYHEISERFTTVNFKWTPIDYNQKVQLMQSIDNGKIWLTSTATIDSKNGKATVANLEPNYKYIFKLKVNEGRTPVFSNEAYFLSGKIDIKSFGVTGEKANDDTEKINSAIDSLSHLGGGILLFSKGEYGVRTVHLKSNVWLYLEKDATIKALTGTDEPRPTWFSDIQYRTGLSPTQIGPYVNPENWLTKQDMGHTFFANAMFFAERENNIKIIGNGRISGNNNLFTANIISDRPVNRRGDKMFSFKLCSNIEIGGVYREEDLWYDEDKDIPYYLKDTKKNFDTNNMLQIDQGGHFVYLFTGTDNIYVHDTFFGKESSANARDIYDFMQCNNVVVNNIYSKVSGDDIIKLGSDCSLGFTRPVSNYKVRNIIGDTHCNLFQIGSETADDIMDVHVDNIYVLGANKAGFSISTNDGAHVKDVHLNCGHTGTIHSRSKMLRTTTPFFISISNRARILGATAGRYKFKENGIEHDELLATNVNIGQVENIILNGIDISEVYKGGSYKKSMRWKPYDGSQAKATPIVAGYKLPDSNEVYGGLDFKLPNSEHTGFINNISFHDVNVLVKGGNNLKDIYNIPPELGVGQYNVPDLKVQPSYGLWVRHAKNLKVDNCTFNYEKRDSRYPLYLDDVIGAKIEKVQVVCADDNKSVLGMKQSSDILVKDVICYDDAWGNSNSSISNAFHKQGDGEISAIDLLKNEPKNHNKK